MNSRRIRFGVLGCGAAGVLHAAAIRRSASSELVLVADIEEKAAQLLAQKYQVPYVLSAEAMLENKNIDAVSIALPHHLHYQYALMAASLGKHAIIEKPFTTSQESATQLIDTFTKAGLYLSVWLERRYFPFVKLTRQFLSERLIGEIIYITVDVMGYKPRAYWEYGMRFDSFPSDWRKHWETSGGGILLMNGIHQIDLIRYITSLEVVEVTAKMGTLFHDVEVEDTIAVLFKFNNGAIGRVDCSCATFGAGTFPIDVNSDRIFGTDGNITLGTPLETFDRIWHHRRHDVPKYTVTDAKIEAISDFAEVLLSEDDFSPHLVYEIIRSQNIIKSAYESAKTDKTVRLNQ